MAVAVGGGAVTVAARGARLLSEPRTLAAVKTSSFVTRTSSSSKLGFCAVRIRGNELARKKRFVVRAARSESQGVSLGFRAPNFQLPEPLTGKTWTLDDFEPYPALLVMFICNHCPFVKHLKKDFVKLSNFYMKKGLAVVAISSNSVATHPQDGPKFMAEEAKLYNYPFPYLYDETQDVARDFGAVCTPEFFLFKKDGRRPFELVYHGQYDDSRPSNNVPVTGRDLSLAIDSVLSGQPVSSIQKPRLFHPTMALNLANGISALLQVPYSQILQHKGEKTCKNESMLTHGSSGMPLQTDMVAEQKLSWGSDSSSSHD